MKSKLIKFYAGPGILCSTFEAQPGVFLHLSLCFVHGHIKDVADENAALSNCLFFWVKSTGLMTKNQQAKILCIYFKAPGKAHTKYKAVSHEWWLSTEGKSFSSCDTDVFCSVYRAAVKDGGVHVWTSPAEAMTSFCSLSLLLLLTFL